MSDTASPESESEPPHGFLPDEVAPNLPASLLRVEDMPPGLRDRLAWAEHFLCLFDFAPMRCTRRDCRTKRNCCIKAEPGERFRRCEGKPGPHVRHWIIGFWLAELAAEAERWAGG